MKMSCTGDVAATFFNLLPLHGIWIIFYVLSLNCAFGTPMVQVTNRWCVKLPAVGKSAPILSYDSVPAIDDDGTIYVATFEGLLCAVSPAGTVNWIFKTGREVQSSPAIADDGTIYFGSRDRKFYAVTRDGKLKWTFSTGAWVDSSPAIGMDGTVYFGGCDHYFYALNPDGSLKWKFATSNVIVSSPAIAEDGTVYFGSEDKNFYALNPDGSVRSIFKTGGEITDSPAIGGNDTIFFTSLDGNLYAVDSNLKEQWRYHTGSITASSPVLDNTGNIYVAVNKNIINTFSPKGKFRWGWPAAGLMDETVAAGSRYIYAANPWFLLSSFGPNREHVWDLKLLSNVTASPTVGPDGTIYVVAGQYLYAIDSSDSRSKLSPWPIFRGNSRHTGRVMEVVRK